MRSAQEIWETAKGQLQLQLNRASFQTYLKETQGLSFEGGLFSIGVRSPFVAEWLQKRLCSLVRRTLVGLLGEEVEVDFQFSGANPSTPCPGLNPRYTFDSFVVGKPNRLAYTACWEVAKNPGLVFNPLALYSEPGLGKTHLLHAIAHHTQAHGKAVALVSAEEFTHEFITSLQERKTQQFRTKYRSLDLLLFEDVSGLGGKEQTQESFFHIFEELYQSSRQIVLTSQTPPQSLPYLEGKLRSRLEGGLIATLQPPDAPTRILILKAKAQQLGLAAPQEALEYIAQTTPHSVRDLEGKLLRLKALAGAHGSPLTLDLAKQALRPEETEPLSPETVLAKVASFFQVSPEDLSSRKRTPRTVLARHLAVFLLREELGLPFSQIRLALGEPPKSTLLYGYEKIARNLDKDASLQEKVSQLRLHIRN